MTRKKSNIFRQKIKTMRKIYLLFLLVGFIGSTIIAQSKSDLEVIAKIRKEGFQNSQVMDIVSYICDVHGNRLVGSVGIKAAQNWAKEKMVSIGLENVEIEPILDHGDLAGIMFIHPFI